MAHAGTVVILAAGQGTRMKSSRPKVLHPVCGRPMLSYVLDQARALGAERILVVVGEGADEVERLVREDEDTRGIAFVHQGEQLGTGHALQMCLPELESAPGPVIVLYGDMPLLTEASLEALCAAQVAAGAALLTAKPARPRGFGRIVRGPLGTEPIRAIVEEQDASEEQLAIREVNVGVYAFAKEDLINLLPRLANDNAQGEYYLTDIVSLLLDEGREVVTVLLEDERDAIGINTIAHLSEARAAMQERILEEHMAAGVYVEDPATTYVDYGVRIGAGTRILPCTVIRAGVEIGAGCEVGPFTHLRVGTVLADGAEVGNFTEAKQARLGSGTKAKHLAYLGDVEIGSKTNIGAGTIVANYDGKTKHKTHIGDRAFIGSGTVLIAPTRVGDGALTGGGAVVTRGSEIPSGDVWVGVPARPIAERKAKSKEESQGGK
ncbi:MAG: NTP transferase domain-containing protein [Planctomycetota bacterium]|nr:NTP transferase domain-containing protein [Planctomycetota bacterium]